MFKKLLGSISISGALGALLGYLSSHADPTVVTVVTTLVGAIGALVHHTNISAGGSAGK